MDIVPSQVRHLEKVTYKKAFVEAKVMVDRHNLITTVFFVSHKTKTKIKKFEGIGNQLWGASLVSSKDIGDNEVVACADTFLHSLPVKAGRCCLEDIKTFFGKVVVQEWDT